jgi:hypothetical protein
MLFMSVDIGPESVLLYTAADSGCSSPWSFAGPSVKRVSENTGYMPGTRWAVTRAQANYGFWYEIVQVGSPSPSPTPSLRHQQSATGE